MTPILAAIDPWILTFSAATVIATVWMGFWAARKSKTASDFYVAGRSVSVGWNASAISGEYLSAASFMGVAGMVMSMGYDALWYPVCYACGYLFLLLFIAGPLRRFGAYTVPDLAEGRFDSPLFRKIAVIFVLFIGFFYTMPQMKGAGTTLAYIFQDVDLRGVLPDFFLARDAGGLPARGLPYWAGVVLVGAVITLNVALGGMKGITLVQAFQYWAKMFAISVPIFVLMAVYGHYGKQLELNSNKPNHDLLRQFAQSNSALIRSNVGVCYYSHDFELKLFPAPVESVLNLANEIKISLSSKVETVTMPSTTVGDLVGKVYVHALEHEVAVSTNVQKQPFSFAATNVTPRELLTQIERSFNNSGLILLKDQRPWFLVGTNDIGRLISTETLRKRLPEKAPADSTWLSPFGPLTTKAAKAATTGKLELDWSKRSQLSDPLPFIQKKPNPLRDLDQFTEKLQGIGGKPAGGFCVWNTNEPVWTVLSRLKSAAGLIDILCETNLLLKIIESDGPRELRPAEFVPFVESTLKEQGVSLIRASSREWWAVPTSQVTAYFRPMDTKPYALLYTYSLIIALVCGTAGLPHILVRFYTNPDGVAAKRTTMWVMILIGIFYVFPPVFGVMGRNLLPDLYAATGAKGTDKIVLELPRLLNEKYAPLGSILSGITCAGAFAAFMSTFSGLLVSMTGAMAHDVYGRMLNPKATGEQRLRAFKIAAVVVGGVAILLGTLVEPLQINFMVGQAFAIAAASYFPLLFMCAWWRNLTMKGAATGMLTGGLAAVFAISLTSFSDLANATDKTAQFFAVFKPMNEYWAAHPLLRILCEQPAIWTVPLAIGLMVVVSKLTSKEVPKDIRMKMLVLHAPEKLGLKQEYIQEHQHH